MKTTKHNNLGKFLVEDCRNIHIEQLVRQSKLDVLKVLVSGSAEIGGYELKITSKKLHHGGDRLYFVCPLCGRAVGVIFRHPLNKNIGCRVCLDLEYRSRRYSGMAESELKR